MLVHLATQQRGRWIVGTTGVLLPGLRRIAASVASVDRRAASHIETDLLELLRDAIAQQPPGTVQLALGVLRFRASRPAPLGPMAGDRALGV
jgi:hypothetical protein